jgi:hypothetical protein
MQIADTQSPAPFERHARISEIADRPRPSPAFILVNRQDPRPVHAAEIGKAASAVRADVAAYGRSAAAASATPAAPSPSG